MTYLLNISQYLMSKGIDSYWIATGVSDSINLISISDKQVSNLQYLWLLIKKNKLIPNQSDCIIHSQRPDFIVPYLLMRRQNKLLCTLHGRKDVSLSLKKGKLIGMIYRLIAKYGLTKANQLISVDAKSTEYFLSNYQINPKRICTIPIGVDFRRFYPQNKKEIRNSLTLSLTQKYILFIGRLEYEKNLFFLLKAFKSCTAKREDITLLLIGSGSYQERLASYIDEESIPQVEFLGEKNNEAIPQWINAVDLVVLCSIFEASPTVIREALACNIPALSLDVGDAKQVLCRFGDDYIVDRNEELFSERILKLLEKQHPDFRTGIEDYSSDTMAQKTLECYQALTDHKKN